LNSCKFVPEDIRHRFGVRNYEYRLLCAVEYKCRPFEIPYETHIANRTDFIHFTVSKEVMSSNNKNICRHIRFLPKTPYTIAVRERDFELVSEPKAGRRGTGDIGESPRPPDDCPTRPDGAD
jgi:hypothetical protein